MNPVVIFTGLLTPYQGIDLLLEAIPIVRGEVPSVKFLMIGYPNEDIYRQKARALRVDDSVHFTGRIPHEELPRYLSLADVAVSPKISTSEANLKLLLYLAMGLPTVVFDNPANREILGDLGIYARPGDATSLAEALIGILQDQSRARQLGAQARQKATRDYTWLAVGQRLKTIYDSVERPRVSNNGHPPKEDNNGRIEDPRNRRSRLPGIPFSK